MKTSAVLFFLLATARLCQAQDFEFGSGLTLSQPGGSMARNMSTAFGLNFEVSQNLKTPFALGIDVGIGNYGYQTTRQQYTFDDGSVTETNVNVSNDIFTINLTGKHFLRNNKNFNPYLSGKIGWSWFTTRLTIEDPEDESSCHPIESDILSRDNTYSVSGGAGLRIDFSAFFKKIESHRFYFDMSIEATHGGIIKYMNCNMDPSQPAPDQDVMAKFINTKTQVIHEHHVGYLYNSALDMVSYRLGVICRPANIKTQK
jgi:hypothetical protein